MRDLYRATREALAAGQLQFEPLLPDDDAPLAERAQALGEFCQGFLYGLGTSALPDPESLPEQVAEIVRDLGAITRVGTDPEESEEDNEQAYADDHGADDAFPITDIDEILPGLMESRARVFYTVGVNRDFDQRVVGWVNGLRAQAKHGRHAPHEIVALEHALHEMRLRKSRAELEQMRHAARIGAAAHLRAMRHCRPGLFEYEVAAEIRHEFHRADADISYLPIVGGGANGCILHYRENASVLRDGELLLIDAGCEFRHYASDITRTFPVNGRFTAAQRAAYDLVVEANLAAIDAVRPGEHWNRPHEVAVQVLTAGMVRLGLLKGRVPTLIKEEAYRRFYMHKTGHWLGMDVHDVGEYKIGDAWRALEPGMVLTIEPGLYIPPGTRGVPPEFRNIGIRIEDDVLVTREGREVLTD
ncbi:MAG: M24 family metallopeptidase, partial [Gammaproteobacteria bacterium]|nr:M24 family metallopeptidase [Gammaproteobacteria bacterium]